jgi:hypothetical protein
MRKASRFSPAPSSCSVGHWANSIPDTQDTIYELAVMHYNQGLYGQAEPLLTTMLEARRRSADHPDIARVLTVLGKTRLGQRNLAAAAAKPSRVSRRADRMPGNDSLRKVCSAPALRRRHDLPKPSRCYWRAMRGSSSGKPPSRLGSQSALKEAGESITQLYRDCGKPEKAADWQQRLQAATPTDHVQ